MTETHPSSRFVAHVFVGLLGASIAALGAQALGKGGVHKVGSTSHAEGEKLVHDLYGSVDISKAHEDRRKEREETRKEDAKTPGLFARVFAAARRYIP